MSYCNLNDKLKKKINACLDTSNWGTFKLDGNQLRPMRAINLSKALVSKGHKVEIISTRFFHQEKRFRKNIKNNNITD